MKHQEPSKRQQLNSPPKTNSSSVILHARAVEEDGSSAKNKKQKRNRNDVDDTRDLDSRDRKCAKNGKKGIVSPSSFANNSYSNPSSSKLTAAQRFKERRANRLNDLEKKVKEFFDDNTKLREEVKRSSEKLKTLSDMVQNVGVAMHIGELAFEPKSQEHKDHLCELVTNIATQMKHSSPAVADELLSSIAHKIQFRSVTKAKNHTTPPVTRQDTSGTYQQNVYHTTCKESVVNVACLDCPKQQTVGKPLKQFQPDPLPIPIHDSSIQSFPHAHNAAVVSCPRHQPPNDHWHHGDSAQSESPSFIAAGADNTTMETFHRNMFAASALQQNFRNSRVPQMNSLIPAPADVTGTAYTDTNQGGGDLILNHTAKLLILSLFGQNNIYEKSLEFVQGQQR